MVNIVDIGYCHRWLGDSWFGPGTVGINLSLALKKSFIMPTDLIYKKQEKKKK